MAAIENAALRSLQTHIEDMRSLTLCKICLKPFYEPYILACGHTYCYSCLRNWFGGSTTRQKNKNCPDCRTIVRVAPAPNYLLRDLTHLFIGRTELLPEDESVAEHDRESKEEAKILTQDRTGPGLFLGAFKTHAFLPPIPPLHQPIRDLDDGVMRCPSCTWELEGEVCFRCGWFDEDMADDILDEEDLSSSVSSDEDDFSETHEEQQEQGVPQQHFFGADLESNESDEDDTDGSEPNTYDVHDDFVDNEEDLDADDMDAVGDYDIYHTDVATPYSDATSNTGYSSEPEPQAVPFPLKSLRRRIIVDEDEDDDDTIDHESPPPDTRPTSRGRRPIVISDDEEEEDNDSGPNTSSTSLTTTNFDHAPDLSSQEEEDDEDSIQNTSTDFSHAPDLSSQEEDNEDIGSHDDDEDDSNSSSDDTSENDSDDSEDTVIPPQPQRNRQQRLQEHRARRPNNDRATIDLRTPPSRGYNLSQRNNNTNQRRRGRTTPVY